MKDQKPPSGSLLETTRLITDAVNDIRLGLQWNDDEGDCLISKAADRLEMHARTLRILAGSEKRLAAKPIHQVLSEEPPSTAWKVMAVKVPEHLHAAIVRESGGDVAQCVRQTLAARRGVEYA